MTRSPCLALRRALLAATVSASAALRRALFAARFSVRLGRSVCLSAGPVAHSLQPRQCPSGLLHRSAQDVSGTVSWHHARHGASGGASASELNSEWPFGREAPHATASASPARARRISFGCAARAAAPPSANSSAAGFSRLPKAREVSPSFEKAAKRVLFREIGRRIVLGDVLAEHVVQLVSCLQPVPSFLPHTPRFLL